MIKNPIINELKKLKLINKSDFNIISNTTRDKKIRVIKDKKSKIIFLNNDVLTQSNNVVKSNKIIYATDSENIIAGDKKGKSRVKMTIEPKREDE